MQPIAGAVADRYGPGAVLVGGILIMALGSAVTPLMESGCGLIVSLGFISAIGSGAGSFSVLIGAAAAARLPAQARGVASGVLNAGGSFGQFVFAPILQQLIHQIGGFFGAYLGGLTITRFGDYGWMWYADMALASLAALLNLPIREAPVARPLSPA